MAIAPLRSGVGRGFGYVIPLEGLLSQLLLRVPDRNGQLSGRAVCGLVRVDANRYRPCSYPALAGVEPILGCKEARRGFKVPGFY